MFPCVSISFANLVASPGFHACGVLPPPPPASSSPSPAVTCSSFLRPAFELLNGSLAHANHHKKKLCYGVRVRVQVCVCVRVCACVCARVCVRARE